MYKSIYDGLWIAYNVPYCSELNPIVHKRSNNENITK